MQFMPRKTVKGQPVTDFLADHPVLGTLKLYDDLPYEIAEVSVIKPPQKNKCGQLFFDEASRTSPEGNIVTGVGIILISPHNYVIPHAFSLTELCSNSVFVTPIPIHVYQY